MAIGSEQYALLFKIKGDASESISALKKIKAETDTTAGGFSKIGASVGSFFGNLGASLVSSITSALAEASRAVLNFSSKLQQSQVGFASLLGSTEKANKLLKELQELSTKTPFDFEPLAAGAQRMIAAGVATDKVVQLMKDLGNVVAATGDVSAERLEGISTALTQMISKTKVSAEEMEQLAERGIPAWRILSEALGKSQAEVRKLAEQGKISSDVMVAALQKISRERWGDAMAKQGETFQGSINIIKNILLQTGATMFKPFFDQIAKFSSNFAKNLKQQEGPSKSVAFAFGKTIGESVNAGWMDAILKFREDALKSQLEFINGIIVGWKGTANVPPVSRDYKRPGDIVTNQQKPAQTTTVDNAEIERQKQIIEERRRQANEAAQRDLNAAMQLWKNYAEDYFKNYNEWLEILRKEFEQTGDAELYRGRLRALNADFQRIVKEIQGNLAELEERQIKAEKKTTNEIEVIRQERAQRERDWWNKQYKAAEEAENLINDVTRKNSENQFELLEKRGQRELDLVKATAAKEEAFLKAEYDRRLLTIEQYIEKTNAIKLSLIDKEIEINQRLLQETSLSAEKREEISSKIAILQQARLKQEIENFQELKDAVQGATDAYATMAETIRAIGEEGGGGLSPSGDTEGGAGGEGEPAGIFGGWSRSFKQFFNLVEGKVPTLKSMFTDLAGILGNAFQSIAQGIGSVIQNWVLYGETGPAVMRKILAAALATIAAEAAVRAIFELAAGFAALFFNPAEAAAHFTAAALFGTIAGVAAIAGRAVAGNAFKRENSTATGQTASGSGSRTSGGAYSGQSDQVIDASRNTPGGLLSQKLQATLNIKLDSNGVLKVFEDDINRNGKTRGLILRVAESV